MELRKIMNKLIPEDPNKVIRFIIYFYIIGVAGFIIPYTHEFFISLTKWALLLMFFLLLWFHRERYDLRTIAVFFFIFLAGLIIEIIGVNTGLIFGSYDYGSGLGIKVQGTPLLIGINWLLLSYCAASVLQGTLMHPLMRIFLGASIMLVYDLILEIAAPMLDLWSWKAGAVPVENYLAWFVIAFIFQALLVSFRIKLRNPISFAILLSQFLFFVALAIYKTLLP